MAATSEAMLRDQLMKPKLEEIVMREMNLLSVRSHLREIERKLNDNHRTQLDLLIELCDIERWFMDHELPIPPNV